MASIPLLTVAERLLARALDPFGFAEPLDLTLQPSDLPDWTRDDRLQTA